MRLGSHPIRALPRSQKYPAVLGLFYPSRGDFVGFVGNTESRDLVRRATRSFRESARFPSEGVAAPATLFLVSITT